MNNHPDQGGLFAIVRLCCTVCVWVISVGQLTEGSYIPVMPLEPGVSRVAVREGSLFVFVCVGIYIYIYIYIYFFAEGVNLT